MEPREVRSAADAKQIVEDRGLSHVKVGVFDVDGILRGKYMSREKFSSSLDKGSFGFCDVVLGWDSSDQLYDNVSYTGWHTGYPDSQVRLLPAICRSQPFEGNMLFFLGEFADQAEALCPRAVLRRVIEQAATMDLSARAGFEYEFFVFDETPQSIRDQHYRDLTPMAPGFFGYSVLRNSSGSDFYQDILSTCETMDLSLEGLHEETGPGALEAAIAVSSALESADKAALFKTFIKVLAQKRGKMATFMAKWSPDWPGQSGHIHISLNHASGHSAFHDPARPHNISATMEHFVGGMQALLPELLAMVAPTINSFTRLVPGFWAPTHATWGIDNRTCALRVIPGSDKSIRVEYRIAGADTNPYLGLAAALGSGLWGIEHKIPLCAPVTGNAYEQSLADECSLPASLGEAAQRLTSSSAARELFGDPFVDHFAATRQWEEREFRRAITDWELARYFEII